jgi:hypothetical protein
MLFSKVKYYNWTCWKCCSAKLNITIELAENVVQWNLDITYELCYEIFVLFNVGNYNADQLSFIIIFFTNKYLC